MTSFEPNARLQTKAGICEYLGGIKESTYDLWQRRGIAPGPVPGTSRYDVRAHDMVLDKVQGLHKVEKKSALQEWKERNAHAA